MRVALPSLPLQVAATPVPPTVKTVLSVPLVSPLTGPSKFSVRTITSPALSPAVPEKVVRVTAGAGVPSTGAMVSIRGSGAVSMAGMLPACAKALPAASARPLTSAVFNAASSISSWPFWPAWTV